MDTRLERETKWVRKKSMIVKSDEVYSSVAQSDRTLEGKKKAAKQILTQEVSELWHSHVKNLLVQGRFLDLLTLERKCVVWRSIMYSLPVRVLKFLANAVTDTLNTKANLFRWGKSLTNKCKHCDCVETLHHVLNCCPTFLSQGRYTWRHNNILKCFVNVATESTGPDKKIFHDIPSLPGYSPTSTIPMNCSPTNLKPDLCIYDESQKNVTIMELSIPFELGVDKAHQYKTDKYSALLTDIRNNGYDVKFYAIEIGSRGFISENNIQRLKQFMNNLDEKSMKPRELRDKLSKTAVVSSFSLYCAKDEPLWQEFSLLG